LPRSYLVAASALAGIALLTGATVAFWGSSATDESIRASCPQPRASVIPEEWLEQHAAKGTPFYDAVLSAEARAAILQPARVTPAPAFGSGSPERQIETLRAGRVLVRSSAPQQDVGAVDWGITSEGPYYSTQLHGFVGIANALSSAERLPQEVERTIAAFVKDWAMCNIPRPGLNKRSW
jgi:hypothetical protein